MLLYLSFWNVKSINSIILSICQCALLLVNKSSRSNFNSFFGSTESSQLCSSRLSQLADPTKQMLHHLTLFFAWLWCVAVSAYTKATVADDVFCNEMAKKLLEEQFNDTTNYSSTTQAKRAGLFSSTIHNNYVGNMSILRRAEITYDNNFFVTAWVLQFLFEFHGSLNLHTAYDNAINTSVYKAVDALSIFHDKNRASNDLSFSFWPQYIANSTTNQWCAGPENLMTPLKDVDITSETIDKICKDIESRNGTDAQWAEQCIAKMNSVIQFMTMFLNAFGIPADMDDSSVALAISSYFKQFESLFGIKTKDLWFNNSNTDSLNNIQSFSDNLSKYAYRPLSSDNGVNIIDARSYYWLRNFIYSTEDDNSYSYSYSYDYSYDNLAFVATWEMTNEDMIVNNIEHLCYEAPFNMNNVDATVAANAIFGLTRSLVWMSDDNNSNSIDWFNDDVQRIYHNTTNLLIWIIENNWPNRRPELLFLYYPPRYDFYWFVSRILREYRSIFEFGVNNNTIGKEYPFIDQLYQNLNQVMKFKATSQILSNALNSTSDLDQDTIYYYWQEFLGLADKNLENEDTPHYDDRLFDTAMCINALINIWSTIDNQGNIKWLDDTPTNVQRVLQGAVTFLKQNSQGGKYRPVKIIYALLIY